MFDEEVTLFCGDCEICANGGVPKQRSKLAVAAKLTLGPLGAVHELGVQARKMNQKLDKTMCSLCEHKESEHKGKITEGVFALSPSGINFNFQKSNAIAIRSTTCIEAAETRVGLAFGLKPRSQCSVVFLFDRIEFVSILGGETIGSISYQQVRLLEFGGPGLQVSGGGFAGGGFGLAGFAIGVATAGVLNQVTKKTSIQTVVKIGFSAGDGVAELMFVTSVDTPQGLDKTLKPITLQLAENTRAAGATPAPSQTDKVTRLKELSELKELGVIDEDEFARLKSEILG